MCYVTLPPIALISFTSSCINITLNLTQHFVMFQLYACLMTTAHPVNPTHRLCSPLVTKQLMNDLVTCSFLYVTSPETLQTGNTDVQVATRLCTVVSLRWIQVTTWGQSPSPLVWRHHMRHTVVQNSSGRQVVWCSRTAALEQAVCFTAVIWQSLPIQKTVENIFVCQALGCGT